MAFTDKVANIINNSISNLTGGLTGGVGNLTGNLKSVFGQPEKLAAKLASKSPLDVTESPVAHMEDQYNPYKYGQLYYPEETSNLGEGHYIIFDIIENNKTAFSKQTFDNTGKLVPKDNNTLVGEQKKQEARLNSLKKSGFSNSIVRNQTSGFNSKNSTHTRLADSIIIYTPASVKFKYGVTYEEAEAGLLGGFINLKEVWSKDTLGLIGGVFEKMAVTAAEVLVPGLQSVVDKTRGFSHNPQLELAFKSVPFRTFSFPFELVPKSQKELDSIHKIINLFKFHMMPEKYSVGHLAAPSEFQITYMYRDNANMYIPKISRCALENMEVDYSPEGVFTTFKGDDKGAAPVIIKMDLQFKEMEIMTKQTIAEGY